MAITRGDLELWRKLRDGGHLSPSPAVLEIGEANWYGDVDPAMVPDLEGQFSAQDNPFTLAKAFYAAVLVPSRMVAIDRDGTEAALRLDLNESLRRHWAEVGEWFDITINTGTTEHVFNQAQVFRTIHDWTKPGGLMVHSFPIAGWPNHGFYTYQPCLLEDLAFFNRYVELARVETEMEQGRQCHLAWRKQGDGSFVIPQQRRR